MARLHYFAETPVSGTKAPGRGRWTFPLWWLLLVPVVCAPVFLWVANRYFRVPPAPPIELADRVYDWCTAPLYSEFWPMEGTPAVSTDRVLLELAYLSGPYSFDGQYHGRSWWITPDGMIHVIDRLPTDCVGREKPAPKDVLDRLADLQQNLPPSDLAAQPTNCWWVAVPVQGRYVVRTYRRDAIPKEVRDLDNALWETKLLK